MILFSAGKHDEQAVDAFRVRVPEQIVCGVDHGNSPSSAAAATH